MRVDWLHRATATAPSVKKIVCGGRMLFSNTSKQDHRRLQKTARSETGPSARQNEHLPFLISEIEANDEPRVCWQREWNWIVYKRPTETRHMLGRTLRMVVWLYVVARPSACVEAKVPETRERQKNRPPMFPLAAHLSRPCLDDWIKGVG